MKVGIITKIGKNYGAVLQAYALKKKVADLGNKAHVIKYFPDISKKSYALCQYAWGVNGTISNIRSLVHYKDNKQGIERFLKFRDEYFDFIGEYSNDAEIEANPPVCDVYISGSDQVWNPSISFDRAFYCMFANKLGAKKVAYAASIGLKTIPEHLQKEFADRVKGFDYVSVREKQAALILSELGIKSEIAPDPTLLLEKEEWDEIAKTTITEPYILCYFVSFPKNIERVVKKFQEKLGLKVVNLMLSETSSSVGDIRVRNAGPKEFIGLFKNASFVITSSFHGTVFSILYEKPFVTTLYKSTSSRVTELLNSFNLSNRIIDVNVESVDTYCNNDLYTAEVKEMKSKMKNEGIEILDRIMRCD